MGIPQMTFKQLCPCVSVSLIALYPTMTAMDETTELPPHICEIFKARGCREKALKIMLDKSKEMT